jgi:YHS domain-containing protein
MPSTVIAAMNYDAEQRILTIVYRGKRETYRYYNVSPEEYEEFRSAPSKGAFLNHTFKQRQHPFERIPSSQGIHLVERS